MIRWKGLVIFVVLAVAVLLIGSIFTDQWLEHRIEKTASRLNGARVEIDRLDFTLFRLDVRWDRLQVTDSDHTMQNLLETGESRFHLRFRPLLGRRVQIEELQIEGLRSGTPRDTDGKLPARKEVEREPGFLAQTIRGFRDNVQQKAELRLDSDKGKLNADSLLRMLEIQSVDKIDSLRQQYTRRYDDWQARLTAFNPEKDLGELKNRVESIQPREIKDLQKLQETLTTAQQIRSDVGRLQTEVTTLSEKLRKDLRDTQAGLEMVDDWIQADYRRAVAKAQIPEISAQNIGKILFGPKVMEKLNRILGTIEKVRYYSAKLQSQKPPKEKPERLRGQDIHFAGAQAQPKFWIRRLRLAGETADRLEYGGTITDLSSQPRLIGHPIAIDIAGSGPNAAALQLRGKLDYTAENPRENLELSYSGFSLEDVQLSESKLLPNRLSKGVGELQSTLALTRNTLEADIRFEGRSLAFAMPQSESDSDEIQKIIQRMLKRTDAVDMDVNLHVTDDRSSLRFQSSLDQQLVAELKAVVGEEIQALRAQIEKKVNDEVTGKQQEFESWAKAQEQNLRNELESYEQQVNDALQEVEDKRSEIENEINERKKNIEKQARDKLKSLIPG